MLDDHVRVDDAHRRQRIPSWAGPHSVVIASGATAT